MKGESNLLFFFFFPDICIVSTTRWPVREKLLAPKDIRSLWNETHLRSMYQVYVKGVQEEP